MSEIEIIIAIATRSAPFLLPGEKTLTGFSAQFKALTSSKKWSGSGKLTGKSILSKESVKAKVLKGG